MCPGDQHNVFKGSNELMILNSPCSYEVNEFHSVIKLQYRFTQSFLVDYEVKEIYIRHRDLPFQLILDSFQKPDIFAIKSDDPSEVTFANGNFRLLMTPVNPPYIQVQSSCCPLYRVHCQKLFRDLKPVNNPTNINWELEVVSFMSLPSFRGNE